MTFNEFRKDNIEIHSAVQIGTSASGRPRWQLNTNEGTWPVLAGAYLNERIEDLQNRSLDSAKAPTLIGMPGRKVSIIHTRAHQVVAIEYRGFQLR